MIRLTIDTREPESLRIALRLTFPDSEERALHSADYTFIDVSMTRVGIERKTVSDFIASITGRMKGTGNQRLDDQLQRMALDYPTRVLLIEGNWSVGKDGYLIVGGKRRGMHLAGFQAAQLSLQKKHGFRVLWTPNQQGTILTLKMLVERAGIKEI